MVVDDKLAFIQSLNWTTKNLTETRDYAVITEHKRDVAEVVVGFEADWHRESFSPRKTSELAIEVRDDNIVDRLNETRVPGWDPSACNVIASMSLRGGFTRPHTKST